MLGFKKEYIQNSSEVDIMQLITNYVNQHIQSGYLNIFNKTLEKLRIVVESLKKKALNEIINPDSIEDKRGVMLKRFSAQDMTEFKANLKKFLENIGIELKDDLTVNINQQNVTFKSTLDKFGDDTIADLYKNGMALTTTEMNIYVFLRLIFFTQKLIKSFITAYNRDTLDNTKFYENLVNVHYPTKAISIVKYLDAFDKLTKKTEPFMSEFCNFGIFNTQMQYFDKLGFVVEYSNQYDMDYNRYIDLAFLEDAGNGGQSSSHGGSVGHTRGYGGNPRGSGGHHGGYGGQ
uniref:DUF148 domain-containing protein n=1 Tax=Meloidogyne hapla TaxID=6305 RepID=A0A1I8BLU9_MELHA